MGRLSNSKLDLHATIDKLLLFRSDLELYYWERPSDGADLDHERRQIALWMRQVSERALALEDVVMHLGSAIVVVAVRAATRESLRCASQLFDRTIGDDEPFDEVRRSVADVLHAADRVWLLAAMGKADVAPGRSAARIERVTSEDGAGRAVLVARIVPGAPAERAVVPDRGASSTRRVGS